MKSSMDVLSTSTTSVLRDYDYVRPAGLVPTQHQSEVSADTAQLLHVSPSGQQRSLDDIERDFLRCLCGDSNHP